MPFQSSFLVNRLNLPPVILLSAGEDRTIICGEATIYLQAVVDNNDNLPGHALTWEQLDGNPVILTNSNTLLASYPFVETSDKVFRFWIDKGHPQEQFKDVRIFHTPTSLQNCSAQTDQYTLTSPLDPIPVNCNDITSTVDVIVPTPTSLEGEELGVTIEIGVEWLHPGGTYEPYIVQYDVFENGVLKEQIPDTIPADKGEGNGPPVDPLQHDGILATYKINTLYNIAGFEYYRESCDKDFNNLVLPNVLVINDNLAGISTTSPHKTFGVVRYGFLSEQASSETTNSTMPTGLTLTVQRYGFLSESEESDVAYSSTTTGMSINIGRTDPSGIGG